MPTPKKLNRLAPMSIRQQFGDDQSLRSLQRSPERGGGDRQTGDKANQSLYDMMKYVEGRRSRNQRASYEQGGRFSSNHLGERMYGQETSEIKKDDKGTFVWYAGDAHGLSTESTDQEWKDAGAVKVYGDFSKYAFPTNKNMIKDDHDYIIRPTGDGSYELDEEQTQAQAGMEKGYYMAEEVQYNDRGTTKDLLSRLNEVNRSNRGVTPGRGEREMAGEARGGMGASPTEDLLERLNQYKRNTHGGKYQQGGEVKGNGPSIKIAGQYAYEPIATTESGEQYVTMELPDGTMATVFGDWETYGNPNQEGYIEDLDYRIIPRGDGSYELDAGEMESEMLRDEARGFAKEAVGGQGASATEDLLERLNQAKGMGFMPNGKMRPVKR